MSHTLAALFDLWREAEAEHDLFVSGMFGTEPGRFAIHEPLRLADIHAIERLRSDATRAHNTWLQALADRARSADPAVESFTRHWSGGARSGAVHDER